MRPKAFISQPMRGKKEDEIKKERKKVIEICTKSNYDIIDTIFDFGDKSPIYYLAKSIEAMADADIVIFMKGWEQARGCLIEYKIAKTYGKNIFILEDTTK